MRRKMKGRVVGITRDRIDSECLMKSEREKDKETLRERKKTRKAGMRRKEVGVRLI